MTAPKKRAARAADLPATGRRQKTPAPDHPAEPPPGPAAGSADPVRPAVPAGPAVTGPTPPAGPVGPSPTAGPLVPAAGPDATSPPVAQPQEHHLDSGLVDYGMWIRMFEEAPPVPPPPEGYRRGRIWA